MGDRGKMSSFPDPLELKELDGHEDDPSVFDRKTAVPGEVPDAPPDGTAGSDDQVSGLHQRQTPDEALPSFREPVIDDDLPPVLGRPPAASRSRTKSQKPAEPKAEKPAEWKTGKRRTYSPKRPVLELELDDIEAKQPPPGRRPEALEAPIPERPVAQPLAPISRPVTSEPLPVPEPEIESPFPLAVPISEPQISPEVLDMRDRYATGDFTGALVLAQGLLETRPDHEEARRCHERCTDVLSQMYLARLGSPAQAVRVAVPSDQIRWLSLDHRAGFLLSLVDGHSTIEELLDISGMPRLDALRILYGLLDQRVIALAERP